MSCYDCDGLDAYQHDLKLVLSVTEPHVASVASSEVHQAVEDPASHDIVIDLKETSFFLATSNWTLPFNLTGEFLGFTKVKAKLVTGEKGAKASEDSFGEPVECSFVYGRPLPVFSTAEAFSILPRNIKERRRIEDLAKR